MISGRTRIAAVIGDPIGHSLSPAMHNAAFAALGIDAAYVAFHVRPSELQAAVRGLRALGVVGFNVTVPHKEKIVRLLDAVGGAARRTGAVNTVIPCDGGLRGENTDVVGFERALDEAGVPLAGARVVLIGAGGAARAALEAFTRGGVARVTIVNRTLARARRLRRDFPAAATTVEVAGLAALEDEALLADASLVVNSSSLGLGGEPFAPVAFAATGRGCAFFDMIPKRETPFLAGARRARRRATDGSGMLLHQGAAAFELWTGQPAPVAVMRKALQRAQRT